MATAWDVFETAIERASHLVQLYDLLHDSRQRAVRADWADSFNRLMHWPVGEQIVRIDGTDRDSLLVLRESVGVKFVSLRMLGIALASSLSFPISGNT